VGTERDHVAPWRSTYKINLQLDTEVTYVLASGGHNVGIVSEPGHAGHGFRMSTKAASHHYLDPERFLVEAQRNDGSWWPEWAAWLEAHSGPPGPSQPLGATTLGDAPGLYVLQQ
jgi:polyhydroxyalkanoate synthase